VWFEQPLFDSALSHQGLENSQAESVLNSLKGEGVEGEQTTQIFSYINKDSTLIIDLKGNSVFFQDRLVRFQGLKYSSKIKYMGKSSRQF
jgi:hypothetical protein